MTNGDVLRAITDERWARILVKLRACAWSGKTALDKCELYNMNCEKCLLDWLKMEAEDEA